MSAENPNLKNTEALEQLALQDPLVREILEYLNQGENDLWQKTHPNGEYTQDQFFIFDEGMMLRKPLLVSAIVSYIQKKGLLTKTLTLEEYLQTLFSP